MSGSLVVAVVGGGFVHEVDGDGVAGGGGDEDADVGIVVRGVAGVRREFVGQDDDAFDLFVSAFVFALVHRDMNGGAKAQGFVQAADIDFIDTF